MTAKTVKSALKTAPKTVKTIAPAKVEYPQWKGATVYENDRLADLYKALYASMNWERDYVTVR